MGEETVKLLFEGPQPMLLMEFTHPETREQAMYPFSKGEVTEVVKWVADICLGMNPMGIAVDDIGAASHYSAKFFRVANGGEG